eukprot:13221573-Alexandrium_andersonii.AAC.1
MAPGTCTCGGWYANHKCTNPACRGPEGPVARGIRFSGLATEAREVAMRAARGSFPNAQQFVAWAAALDAMARDARHEADEA